MRNYLESLYMRYFFIAAFLLVCLAPYSQACSKELLAKKPGTWKAGPQGSIANINKIDLVKEKSVLAWIHNIVSTNYKPMGCQVSYSTVYGKYPSEGQTWFADPYHYSMYLLAYLCDPVSTDKSKFYVAVATATTVEITANEIFSLNSLFAASIPSDDPRGYLKLKKRPEVKGGYYFLGEEITGDGDQKNKRIENRWLITYNDTLPFSYVSRKEYLLIQRKRLEQSLKDNPGEKEYTNKFLQNISEYLKNAEADLKQPAVCMWNDEERFEKFVKEGTMGSFIAVKPNPDYYHKSLPKSSPQFFSLVFSVAQGDPVYEENIAAIQKAVDFDVLKSKLGK